MQKQKKEKSKIGEVDRIVKDYQFMQLNKLLSKLFKHNKFYQDKLKSVGINKVEQIKNWKDFYKIPFTTKNDLLEDQRKYPPYGRNAFKNTEDYIYEKSTSGTSGRSLKTVYDSKDFQGRVDSIYDLRSAVLRRLDRNDRVMEIFPHGAYVFEILAWQKMGLLTFPPDGLEIEKDLLKKIIDNKINVLHTTVSKIIKLTNKAKELRINLKDEAKVKYILCGGEVGFNILSLKQLVAESWGATCLHSSGSTEAAWIGLECPETGKFHLNDLGVVVEVIDQKTKKQSSKGELVITPLWRHSYPLIRYRTGDYIELKKDGFCACNPKIRAMRFEILGRIGSEITIGGKKYWPRDIEESIREVVGLREFRLIYGGEHEDVKIIFEADLRGSIGMARKLSIVVGKLIGKKFKVEIIPNGSLSFNGWKSKRFITYNESKTEVSNLKNFSGSQFKLRIIHHMNKFVFNLINKIMLRS